MFFFCKIVWTVACEVWTLTPDTYKTATQQILNKDMSSSYINMNDIFLLKICVILLYYMDKCKITVHLIKVKNTNFF